MLYETVSPSANPAFQGVITPDLQKSRALLVVRDTMLIMPGQLSSEGCYGNAEVLVRIGLANKTNLDRIVRNYNHSALPKV